MIKGLLVLAIVLLCMVGISNLIWSFLLWFSHHRESHKPALVTILPRQCGEVEPTLRNALFEAESIGYRRCSGLIAVDDHLPDDCRAIAEAFCNSHDGVILCYPEQLAEHLTLLQTDCSDLEQSLER